MTIAPLRVAHVVSTAGSTGVEAHLTALLPSFNPARVAPILFAPGPGPLVDRLRARGVAVEFGAPRRKLAVIEARRLVPRWRGSFDVVHAHGPRAAFWAGRVARDAGVSVFVVTLHELRWRSLPPGLKRWLWIRLEDGVLARATGLIAVSHAVREETLARHPGWADRLVVIPGSTPMLLDADRLPRARPGARDGGPFRLVTVGRLDWVKGYDLLFEALARVAAAGLDFTLDLVGEGRLDADLRARATLLGLAGRIRWDPRPSDLPALLAQAHAFVTASRAETFGIAALEAMAVGLPVVAPAVGGLADLITSGETGLLLEPGPESERPGNIAAALLSLERDPGFAERLGAEAARRARERFSPARAAEGATALYWRLVGGGP